jgi:hypothetical protein
MLSVTKAVAYNDTSLNKFRPPMNQQGKSQMKVNRVFKIVVRINVLIDVALVSIIIKLLIHKM